MKDAFSPGVPDSIVLHNRHRSDSHLVQVMRQLTKKYLPYSCPRSRNRDNDRVSGEWATHTYGNHETHSASPGPPVDRRRVRI